VITFLHTADWQIGKPFASIADPVKRARVQQERIETIRRIGSVVRERRAAFVIVAGDLFDSPSPTNATVAAALGAIAALEVPVYCIPGNHDHGGPDSLWEQPFFKSEHRRLAANFHLLLEPEPLIVDVGAGGLQSAGEPCAEEQGSFVLLPCPLRRRHEADDPTAWLRTLDFDAFGTRPRIVIAHGSTTAFGSQNTLGGHDTLGGAGLDDDEPVATLANTLALDRLPLDQIDYLALGDWHGFLAVSPKAVYSGAPEIDRFPKPGQRPGHVAVVTAARGAEPRVEPVATGHFRWLVHAVALENSTLEPDGSSAAGPRQLDDWFTEATRPATAGDAGFDACLARLEVSGSVSLAERAELDRIVESWTARLLRLDLDDQTVLAPAPDEIRELAERPGDPIIARVAAELIAMLAATPGAAAAADGPPDPDVIRRAIHILHALAVAPAGISTGPSTSTPPVTGTVSAGAPS
jgi:DNA repair exonuclease SbcCD nuclease subunit